jgi:hypothetical protein
MVLLVSDFDQSKYLNSTTFAAEKALRIKAVTAEMVQKGTQQEKRLVVWFTNHDKGLLLNKTNLRTLAGAFGNDADMWKGKIIVVFPTQTEFAGRIVSALRVRIPPPKQATAGNGQPVKQTKPAKPTIAAQDGEVLPPEPKPSLADDLDDELDF